MARWNGFVEFALCVAVVLIVDYVISGRIKEHRTKIMYLWSFIRAFGCLGHSDHKKAVKKEVSATLAKAKSLKRCSPHAEILLPSLLALFCCTSTVFIYPGFFLVIRYVSLELIYFMKISLVPLTQSVILVLCSSPCYHLLWPGSK